MHVHGRRKDFSKEGPRVVKFVISHSKLRKQPFFAKHFKIQGGHGIPSAAHVHV